MEFVEVMKHKQRMCDHYYRKSLCHKCPLSSINSNNGKGFLGCAEFCTKYPKEAQTIIMNWTKEHPFKTNREVAEEVLTEKFGDIFDVSQLGCSFLKEPCGAITCTECDIHDFWDQEYKEVPKDANGN